jgi:hypothetical protein
MPYLPDKQLRTAIEDGVEDLCVGTMNGAELNFTICTILNHFCGASQGSGVTFNYARINEAMGAATLAPLEWVRRCVAPYEDQKIHENGDLSWPRVQ